MITQALQAKIDHSIALLHKGEKLALKMSDKGYYLASNYRPMTAKELTNWYLYYSKKMPIKVYIWNLRHQMNLFD